MKKRNKMLIGVLSVVVLIAIIFQVISTRTVELGHQIVINAPQERVWQILNQLDAVAHYNPQVDKAKCISDTRMGVGASRECTMHDGSSVKERVTLLEANAVTMELYESSWPVQDMNWRTQLSAKEGGTLVSQKLRYKVKFGALGALLNTLMMRSKINGAVQETFEGLKTYAENDRNQAS